ERACAGEAKAATRCARAPTPAGLRRRRQRFALGRGPPVRRPRCGL
ncbi:MAG: hypothetical protein AVDCRST_MAG39-55, partial [uncultured Sphingomonadaceae bacterium]